MKKIALLFLIDKTEHLLLALNEALRGLGCETVTVKVPYLWRFDRALVTHLISTTRKLKAQGYYVVFCPESTELYLDDPNMSLVYSAYRTWSDARKTRVIPHLWTPSRPSVGRDELRWTSKPPLRLGFMGRSFSDSRIANAAARAPRFIKRAIVGGRFNGFPRVMSVLHAFGAQTKSLGAFPRLEALQVLRKGSGERDVETDVVGRLSFSGSARELKEYEGHLTRSTYVVCPRGTENYSYRMYEALNYGRVPVIIDTNIVLPKEIDWERLSIAVPYESLEDIVKIVAEDYHSHSFGEFKERQEMSFAAMDGLRSDRWVAELARDLVEASRRNI